MNGRPGVVVAVADSSPPFLSTPLLYTRYSQALGYIVADEAPEARARGPRRHDVEIRQRDEPEVRVQSLL